MFTLDKTRMIELLMLQAAISPESARLSHELSTAGISALTKQLSGGEGVRSS